MHNGKVREGWVISYAIHMTATPRTWFGALEMYLSQAAVRCQHKIHSPFWSLDALKKRKG